MVPLHARFNAYRQVQGRRPHQIPDNPSKTPHRHLSAQSMLSLIWYSSARRLHLTRSAEKIEQPTNGETRSSPTLLVSQGNVFEQKASYIRVGPSEYSSPRDFQVVRFQPRRRAGWYMFGDGRCHPSLRNEQSTASLSVNKTATPEYTGYPE